MTMTQNSKKYVRTAPFSLSVGIPTCYSGESLIETLGYIRASKVVFPFSITVVADRTPVTESQLQAINALNVDFTWNEVQGSQLKKLAQIINRTSEDIFVFTQDDIIFPEQTLQAIYEAFESDPLLTMVSTAVLPERPKTLIGHGIAAMVRVVQKVSAQWNNGDNYLSSSGRCVAFRTSHLKKFRLPEQVVNSDAFFYFENLRLGGTFKYISAPVYIVCPNTLKEQVRPSSRFQYSLSELQPYFEFDLHNYYIMPRIIALKAGLIELLKHPVDVLSYGVVFAYTRIFKQAATKVKNTLWHIDLSTKQH